MTPPEVLAYRSAESAANAPGWSLRVVPNKFPALTLEGGLERSEDGVYEFMNGLGLHEVIIETPRHEVAMATLGEQKIAEVLRAYRDRIMDLRADNRFRYILVFRNQGAPAGATLEHAHSQLIALPIVPRDVVEELAGAKEYHSTNGRCVYCDIVAQEGAQGSRVVSGNDEFIALCPFAARFPFETWIFPKTHAPFFEEASAAEQSALSSCLSDTLRRIDRALDGPPFNYIIHSAPLGEMDHGHYHWHLEIIPKLIQVAGFEWGSGFYINPVTPEEAARSLRRVAL